MSVVSSRSLLPRPALDDLVGRATCSLDGQKVVSSLPKGTPLMVTVLSENSGSDARLQLTGLPTRRMFVLPIGSGYVLFVAWRSPPAVTRSASCRRSSR